MSKKFRKILATLAVLSMMINSMPMTFAEGETVATEPAVTETQAEAPKAEETKSENLTVTTTTTTDDNGKGTVTVTIEKEWTNQPTETESNENSSSKTESSETESGESSSSETESSETESDETPDVVINGEETTVITETPSKTTTVVEGSETSEWVEEDNGDEEGQPEVNVELIPGETTTGTATETETTGDVPSGKNDGNYDYTETTTTDRTVDATTEGGEIIIETEGIGEYNPLQTDKDMIYVDENQLHTHYKTSYKQTASATQATLDKQPEEGGYDFLFIGQGQMSDFYVGTDRPDGSQGHSGALQFELMQNPEIANGTFVKDTDENGKVNDKDLFTAYCCDLVTGAVAGTWYKMDNLEDAGYYDEESAAYIRSIASSGYWGTNPGEDAENPSTGSLEKLKKEMLAVAAELGLTEEEINAITPGQALAATQAAIWTHANATTPGQVVDEERLIINGYKYGSDASVTEATEANFKLAEAVYNYLLGLEPTSKEESTEIIDKDSFIKEDSMSLSVGDKTSGRNENKDNNKNNDVYDVAINFALVVKVDEKNDNLIVQVVNSNGDVVATGRIAGDSSNDEGFNEVDYDAANDRYSLKGLTLAENSDFNFDLQLSGTQYLEEGVYIFTADGGANASQTFVGMAEGDKEVNISQSFTVQFDVDETDYVKSVRNWKSTETRNHGNGGNTPNQPQINLVIRDNSTTESINDEAVPLSGEIEIIAEEEVPMADGLTEILDEDVPLAAVPQTGDGSGMMAMMSLMSLAGIVFLTKKKAVSAQG